MNRLFTLTLVLSISFSFVQAQGTSDDSSIPIISADRAIPVGNVMSGALPGQGHSILIYHNREVVSRLVDASTMLVSAEPNRPARVETPDWMNSMRTGGDDTRAGIESSTRNRAYLRYLVPVAVIAAAGVTTYLLYTTRSR